MNALQGDMAEMAALNDKYKSEAMHNQRSAQSEIMKNNDTTKQLAQAENILRVRVNQVEEGRKEVSALIGENDQL